MSTESEGLKKQHKDMVYDRDYIQSDEVKDTIAQVTGLSRSSIDKIIVDGKVIPVIVLNDVNAVNCPVSSWTFHRYCADIGAGGLMEFGSLFVTGEITVVCDAPDSLSVVEFRNSSDVWVIAHLFGVGNLSFSGLCRGSEVRVKNNNGDIRSYTCFYRKYT